jgi:signal peptidase I
MHSLTDPIPGTRRQRISLVRWVISLVTMLPLVFIWAMFLSKHWINFEVISASMAPTLDVGDRVIMKQEKDYGLLKGQIIAFKDPTGDDGAPLTKRVVAEQNSTVRLVNGEIYVDNATEPLPGEQITEVPNKMWQVGPGQVFVLGDNRNDSYDSIDYGPIPRSSILGVVAFRYWPWSRKGTLPAKTAR